MGGADRASSCSLKVGPSLRSLLPFGPLQAIPFSETVATRPYADLCPPDVTSHLQAALFQASLRQSSLQPLVSRLHPDHQR